MNNKTTSEQENDISETELLRILRSEAGFSSELRAFDIFLQAGITTDANTFYKDSETGKWREIDLVGRLARILDQEEDLKRRLLLTFVSDVKSSSSPIVIFSADPTAVERRAAFTGIFSAYLPAEEKKVRTAVIRDPLAPEWKGRIGRILVKVSKKRESKDVNRINTQWAVESIRPILSATQYHSQAAIREAENNAVLFRVKERRTNIILPILILDAPLFEYTYKNGVEEFNKIGWIPMRFSFVAKIEAEKEHMEDRFIVVSTIDALPSLLKSARTWIESKSEERMAKVERQHSWWWNDDEIPF